MARNDEERFDQASAEGGGALPAWLVAVYVTLAAWGCWYLAHYLRGPAGPAP